MSKPDGLINRCLFFNGRSREVPVNFASMSFFKCMRSEDKSTPLMGVSYIPCTELCIKFLQKKIWESKEAYKLIELVKITGKP